MEDSGFFFGTFFIYFKIFLKKFNIWKIKVLHFLMRTDAEREKHFLKKIPNFSSLYF